MEAEGWALSEKFLKHSSTFLVQASILAGSKHVLYSKGEWWQVNLANGTQ